MVGWYGVVIVIDLCILLLKIMIYLLFMFCQWRVCQGLAAFYGGNVGHM